MLHINEKAAACRDAFGGDNYKRTWMGVMARKNPADAWMYQEIIYRNRPDFIIECGTYKGGGAMFLASMCDLMGHGSVITIDDESIVPIEPAIKQHRRITFINGDTLKKFDEVQKIVRRKIMVILDSNHSAEYVFEELKLYSTLVSQGQYLIVEDTDHLPDGDGPLKAVKRFMENNNDFIVDRKCEEFGLTNNPQGYLQKI